MVMKLTKSKKYDYIYWYMTVKKEKLWSIRWTYYNYIGERKEFSKRGIKTEVEAYRTLLETQTTVVQGGSKEIDYNNITVAQWMDIWYETHENEWKESTKKQRKDNIKNNIKPLIGNYKLSKLDKITYKRVYINKLLERYKPSSVSLFHAFFTIAINDAVENEILSKNRFRGIVIPKEKKTMKSLTAENLKCFLEYMKEHDNITNYTITLLLAYTGMRKGEGLGLQWTDIDFNTNQVSVNRTRDNRGTRTPKTMNSYRNISTDEAVIESLRKYKVWCKKTRMSFGLSFKETDFVFISYQKGTAIGENTLKYAFDRAATHTNLGRVHPHMLRHTHASLLLQRKVTVNTVAERLGNSPEIVMNVYAHVLDSMKEEVVNVFADVINL
ncbi:Integrase [Brachybacterium faecium]|nr:Integrase [Brachybacterium faecium]